MIDTLLQDRFWQGVLTTVVCLLVLSLAVNAGILAVRRIVRGRRLPAATGMATAARFLGELIWQARWNVATVKYPHPAPQLFLERPAPAFDENDHEPVGEPAQREPGPVPIVVPRFGEPVLTAYDPEAYEEPLRCSSGVVCGGRQLRPGESFFMIPSPSDPEGPFLVLCYDDVIVEVPV